MAPRKAAQKASAGISVHFRNMQELLDALLTVTKQKEMLEEAEEREKTNPLTAG